MDAQTRFDTQIVGALPVITHYFGRLEVGAIVDELVPWEGDIPLGTLVEILVANRLLQPKALFRVGTWAGKAGLTDYYGVTAEQLNDDRLGRALERVAEHGEVIQAGLVMKAIKREKGRRFVLNVGLPPQEGKYNETACPKCFEHYTLEEALARRWRCACRGVIKKGVRDRAKELSDDGAVRRPDHRPDYVHIIPLGEIINQALDISSAYTKKGLATWETLITEFGN